jgi:putative PIN family toxin of toxin-antitoxin system
MPVRAVLDTNVLVSGLLTGGGPPPPIVDAWLEGRFVLVTSLYQAGELNHVLAYPRILRRLRLEDAEIKGILAALLSEAEVVPGRLELPGLTRDAKDDAVVACAQEGEADFIVSGDRDLLVLQEYEGIRVVTPRQFLEMLAASGQKV